MDQEFELAIIRRAFSKQVLCAAAVSDADLEEAFAATRREDFVGPGPWSIFSRNQYLETPTADPVYLYVNHPIAIDRDRRINNGEPSLHASLIHAAAIKSGDHIVHIGAGSGYYSALMARLAGSAGRMTALEYETDLAVRAASNLKGLSNVEVVQGNGVTKDVGTGDVIYVNAGVTRPADLWLDRLSEGGRLILPLTTKKGFRANEPGLAEKRGAVFCIERHGAQFSTTLISQIELYPCEGARDPESEAALAAAFQHGNVQHVTRLYRHNEIPEDQCWLQGSGWCLAYR